MKIIAPAKLNLYLHITERRDDGYHLLESLFVFTEFGDDITITPASHITLTIDGPFSSSLSNTLENNLIYRAAMLLKNHYNVTSGAHIHLIKKIPVAAGLGGGSSDAAAVLKGLNDFWKLGLSHETLSKLGCILGADIPACIFQKTALVSGIGEKIHPINLPTLSFVILLVNPNQELSTQTVFQHFNKNKTPFSPAVNSFEAYSDATSFFHKLSQLQNDLEPTAISLLPLIGELIHLLKTQNHCILARMSGSGPTCFALFPDLSSAASAQQQLLQQYPHLWATISNIKS